MPLAPALPPAEAVSLPGPPPAAWAQAQGKEVCLPKEKEMQKGKMVV